MAFLLKLLFVSFFVYVFLGCIPEDFDKKHARKIAFFTLLFAIQFLFLITNKSIMGVIHFDGPYHGQVIDSETGEPIEGAAVAGIWRFEHLVPFIAITSSFANAVEDVTNEEGRFFLPRVWALTFWPFSRISREYIYIYKPEYASLPPEGVGRSSSILGYMPGRCIDWEVFRSKYKVRWRKSANNIVRLPKARSIEEQFIATRFIDFDRSKNQRFIGKIPKTASLIEIERKKLPSEKDFKNEYKQMEIRQKESPDERFIEYGSGEILDTCTGLIWAKDDNGDHISWSDAKQYCLNYNDEGDTTWRLPTITELETLYDRNTSNKTRENKTQKENWKTSSCNINELFNMTNCMLWASESKDAKGAFFNMGSLQWNYIKSLRSARVLLVRDWEGFQGHKISDAFITPYDIYYK